MPPPRSCWFGRRIWANPGSRRRTATAPTANFMARLESLRIEAGRRMGFPNAADLVIPKPVLIAPAVNGGTLSARYFMPHDCHRALAVTGAVAVATSCVTPGTIAADMAGPIALPDRHHDRTSIGPHRGTARTPGSAGGISPPAAHRTVRKPLDLHGSSQPFPCHLR